MVAARSGEIWRKPLPTAAADESRYFFVYLITGTVTKKVGKDVVDWEFVFVYFVVLFVFIIYGGYFLMRVRSREHLGGEFDSILTSCFVVASRCSSAW